MPNNEDDTIQAELRRRVAEQAEILRRHYTASRNPLYVWKVIRLHTGWIPKEPLPEWVMSYLCQAAIKLVDMGEDVDWTSAPSPPPKGSPPAEIRNFVLSYSAWSQSKSLEFRKAPGLALKALELSGPRGKNVFVDYRKAIEDQFISSSFAYERDWQDRARKAGVPRKKLPNIKAQIGNEDEHRSNFKKRMERGLRSLALGRIEPEPGGPLGVRLMKRRLGIS
jgi:hypothetical protein